MLINSATVLHVFPIPSHLKAFLLPHRSEQLPVAGIVHHGVVSSKKNVPELEEAERLLKEVGKAPWVILLCVSGNRYHPKFSLRGLLE